MRRPSRHVPLASLLASAALLLCLLAPATAGASYSELLRDACRDERVDGTYSQKDYRDALRNIPADADQYTNCRQVLEDAKIAAASAEASGGSGPGAAGGGAESGGSVPTGDPLASASADERRAVLQATDGGGAALSVGGRRVDPAALGAGRTVSATISDLPPPLLAVLGLVALAALGAIALVLVPRVRARRQR